ncbi:MAG: NAD(P)H-dependent oxidoreductase subunit E [Desulfitobacterium sp.]
MERIDDILEKYRYAKDNLIQIMLEMQALSGQNYLPKEWVEYVAQAIDLPLNKVYGVISFYAMFSTEPRGKYLIEVCKSGPCHVSGAESIEHLLGEVLGIKTGETTQDGLFTIVQSSCFGACDISPAIKIGEKVYGNLTHEALRAVIDICKEEA